MAFLSPILPISKYFIVGDFTKTSQPVTNAIPEEYLDSLKRLGAILDELYDRVGSFSLISGFRSWDLQELLNSGPHDRDTKSFHEIAQAVDIVPDSNLREYFSKMLADPSIRYTFADISFKPWDGSLHLEAPSRAGTSGRARIKEIGGSYRSLSSVEVTDYIQNPLGSEVVALIKKSAVPLGLGIFILGAGAFMYAMSNGRSRA